MLAPRVYSEVAAVSSSEWVSTERPGFERSVVRLVRLTPESGQIADGAGVEGGVLSDCWTC